MINRQTLLSDLQKLLQKLEADLLERSMSAEVPEVGTRLKEEHERATKAQRTAQNYEDWRTDAITQAAAAWVLSCVFVRFLEDNRLIDPPKISGPASGSSGQSEDRLGRARDEHELYFRKHPKQTDREYLLSIFDQLAKLPGTKDVFGEHNPIRELPNWLSGDAAGELLKFFQKIDANTGALVHDFTDSNWDTRFLGDLYQDLSEAARKKYALLQTPEFVEEFILDRTLDPALDEFGLEPPPAPGEEDVCYDSPSRDSKLVTRRFRMIDPACGSGHFLLGSFPRILDRWMQKEPGTNVRELVQRTLHSIHGVDVNPFAIAIARFRLLLATLKACGIPQLADAPAFEMNLVCGDSLLHAPLAAGGKKYTAGQRELDFALASDPEDADECDHAYRSENLPELKRLLRRGQYHAVVGNPPYITVKDRAVSERYRARYLSCHRKYSLSVPFMERFFELAVKADGTPQHSAGFVGQITANSFMKREFGKKLIEEYLPRWDLTHVLDTSGASIPGHGTPTVILFGKNQPPVSGTIRTVLGIRGEPATPDEPALGLVWQAIVGQIDEPGSVTEWVSATDSLRVSFHKHPWNVGGGGAAELKEQIDEAAESTLNQATGVIGVFGMTNADDVMLGASVDFRRCSVEADGYRALVTGDTVRDWLIKDADSVVFPYGDTGLRKPDELPRLHRWLWPVRTSLGNRATFGKLTYFAEGRAWWAWHQIALERIKPALSITWGEVSTDNHFVIERSGKVFNQTAPIIQLKPDATDEDHVRLVGVLNSSIACFWLRQVSMGKHQGDGGEAHASKEGQRFYFNATKVGNFPIPAFQPTQLPTALVETSTALQAQSPAATLGSWSSRESAELRTRLSTARGQTTRLRRQLIACQEELDWQIYEAFGLVKRAEASRPTVSLREGEAMDRVAEFGLELGQRAFEIVLARKMAAGETHTTWFERHGSTPITELPSDWPDDYRQLVERRIALIESDPNIRLIEQPEYKRRWNTESWESQLERALREWLLNRLEGYFDFDGRMSAEQQGSEGAGEKTSKSPPLAEIQLVSVARLASVAGQDADFLQVGELYRDDAAFDVQALVTELVAPECVPLLPVLRYKPAGLIKRTTWERTWDLQRQEDAIDAQTQLLATDPNYLTEDAAKTLKEKQVGKIPVPTKYDSKDFLTSDFWRLRGKLDVPKERWISFPHCDGPDGTMMLCWAGYDHLQQARAISAYYVQVQTEFGGSDDPRLIPLLACLIELLPWLKRWHNDLDPEFNMSMGDYFEGFINEEARQLGKTLQEIRQWTPPARVASRARKSNSKARRTAKEGTDQE